MAECRANSAAPLLAPMEHAAPSQSAAGDRVRVLLPLPLPQPLDYLAAEGAAAPLPGSFVRVGLGSRQLVGVVWDGEDEDAAVPRERLKPIGEILPAPPLPPELRRFVERVAAYTLAAPGAVLRMTMSVEEALLPPRPRRICAITEQGVAVLADPTAKLTPARRCLLESFREAAAGAAEIARRAGCSVGVVRGLIELGYAEESRVSAA